MINILEAEMKYIFNLAIGGWCINCGPCIECPGGKLWKNQYFCNKLLPVSG